MRLRSERYIGGLEVLIPRLHSVKVVVVGRLNNDFLKKKIIFQKNNNMWKSLISINNNNNNNNKLKIVYRIGKSKVKEYKST